MAKGHNPDWGCVHRPIVTQGSRGRANLGLEAAIPLGLPGARVCDPQHFRTTSALKSSNVFCPVNLLRLAESRSASPPAVARRSRNYTAGVTRFILSNTFAVIRCARGSGPFGVV